MKGKITIVFALISWFAIITQYVVMLENRITSIAETSIRFLSFFTILTNSIVALYFTSLLFKRNPLRRYFSQPGTLTAITTYITIVFMVYQFVLRSLWTPTGMQMIVDELLHSVIPMEVVFFWYLYEYKKELQFVMIKNWLIYPAVYLAYILIRGHFSNFYPYPFVNATELGLTKVLLNSAILMLVFVFFSFLFIRIGKIISKSQEY